MAKKCPTHGEMISVVEIDPAFYYGLKHHRDIESFNQVLFEASDRCQLECPHCYHLPDNKIQDRSIQDILDQLKQFPKDSAPMLAGAEATLRPDFVELCKAIIKLHAREQFLPHAFFKFSERADCIFPLDAVAWMHELVGQITDLIGKLNAGGK
jgi:uncharacterized radical SAM superfamily Fe-S cluster-containing enzyme